MGAQYTTEEDATQAVAGGAAGSCRGEAAALLQLLREQGVASGADEVEQVGADEYCVLWRGNRMGWMGLGLRELQCVVSCDAIRITLDEDDCRVAEMALAPTQREDACAALARMPPAWLQA